MADDGVPVATGTGNGLSAPIKFDGSPNDGNLLICQSPQTDGFRCGGYATAYALIITGCSNSQSQRQTDATAFLDLFKAIGYTASAQESAAFAAFVNGAMRPSDCLTFMAGAIYAAGISEGVGLASLCGLHRGRAHILPLQRDGIWSIQRRSDFATSLHLQQWKRGALDLYALGQLRKLDAPSAQSERECSVRTEHALRRSAGRVDRREFQRRDVDEDGATGGLQQRRCRWY